MTDFTQDERTVEPEQTPMPQIGQRLRLALINTAMYVYKATPTIRVTGNVVRMPTRDDVPDAFALWVEGDMVPLRVIRLRDVHSINGERVHYSPHIPPAKPKARTFIIAGSKGGAYHVETLNGVWRCDCAGFGFRHTCRHISQAQASLNKPQGA